MIYLDNAASTPVLGNIIDVTTECLKEYGNPSSVHQKGRAAKNMIEEVRKNVLSYIHADEGTIIFTSGGSESNNLAILGMAAYMEKNNKKTIITSKIEHPSVLNVCKYLEDNCGFKVFYMPVCYDGRVDIEELYRIMFENKDTLGLVTIQAVNSEIGTIQLINDIGSLCEEFNVPFHTDAVQAISHIDIDVKKDNISLLSLSGHKIFAPKGIGALYVKDTSILSPVILGGGQESGLRSGTENTFGIACLGKVIKLCERMTAYNIGAIKYLRRKFLDVLQQNMKVPYKINHWGGVDNIISLTIQKVEGNSLMLMLNSKDICVSTGSACSTNKLESSHVLKAIGIEDSDAICTIRVSLSSLNTTEEMEIAAKTISEISKQLRDLA